MAYCSCMGLTTSCLCRSATISQKYFSHFEVKFLFSLFSVYLVIIAHNYSLIEHHMCYFRIFPSFSASWCWNACFNLSFFYYTWNLHICNTSLLAIAEDGRSNAELLALDSLAGAFARSSPRLYRVSTKVWQDNNADSYSRWLGEMVHHYSVVGTSCVINIFNITFTILYIFLKKLKMYKINLKINWRGWYISQQVLV